jgi:hypothetical protein
MQKSQESLTRYRIHESPGLPTESPFASAPAESSSDVLRSGRGEDEEPASALSRSQPPLCSC